MNVARYHKKLRNMDCTSCGCSPPCCVHHFAGGSSARRGVYFDYFIIPLCKSCHTDSDDAVHKGKKTFYERTGIDPYAEAAANYVRFLDGRYEKEEALRRLVENK